MSCSLEAPIYLDYNATTPLDPEIARLMQETQARHWGNPSSIHRVGRLARAILDEARDVLASQVRCKPGELVFTSGGTEANNLALLGAARARRDRGRHLVVSPIEHPAVGQSLDFLVRHEGFTSTTLPIDASGRIDPETVRAALRPDTVLVSVMAANNETGALQPVPEIGRLCRERGVLFHTDAVQWFGKESFTGMAQFEADLVTLCAHKLHGPKGAGALFVRSPLPIVPVLHGGGHELERRAGTENLAAIVGLVEAVRRFVAVPVFDAATLQPLRGRLESRLASLPGVTVIAPNVDRLSNTLAFVVAGTDSAALLANLDLAGICASSGSACSSGSVTPSHVLRAMGFSPELSSSLVRFSLGRETTADEVDTVVDRLPELISRSQGH